MYRNCAYRGIVNWRILWWFATVFCIRASIIRGEGATDRSRGWIRGASRTPAQTSSEIDIHILPFISRVVDGFLSADLESTRWLTMSLPAKKETWSLSWLCMTYQTTVERIVLLIKHWKWNRWGVVLVQWLMERKTTAYGSWTYDGKWTVLYEEKNHERESHRCSYIYIPYSKQRQRK